jgi:uncharacterized protein (DUF1499 family)
MWGFVWGEIVAAGSLFIFSLLIIHQIGMMSLRKQQKYTLYEVASTVVLFIVVLGVQITLVWYQSTLLSVRASSPDPQWTDFPASCKPNAGNVPIINCVRTGSGFNQSGIPNPMQGYRDGPISFADFNSSVDQVQQMFETVITQEANCRLIKSTPGFIHARCLTSFMGYPDDTVVKLFCNAQNKTSVWIHSQSRFDDAWYDHNYNDARVRYILQIINLSLYWCTGKEVPINANTSWTCWASITEQPCH